jgi:cytochrome c oxidase subunit IV
MAAHDVAQHGHDHDHGHGDAHAVHVPTRVYYWNFAALMILLVITLVAAYFDLGEWNLLIAITIAVIKAVLIVLFFMHLAYSTRLVRVFAGAALFWLIIMFTLTLGDYFARQAPSMPGT